MSNKGIKEIENKAKPNEWTIMVYLAGDNNLAEEMVYALKCMQLAGSHPPHYEVFALYDAGLGPAVIEIRESHKHIDGLLGLAEASRTKELETTVERTKEEVKLAEQQERQLFAATIKKQKEAEDARNPHKD